MGKRSEETVLVPANSEEDNKSLKTTFPISFVRQFELEKRDKLKWKIQAEDNNLFIKVLPIKKKGENENNHED